MAEHATEHIHVAASPERCYAVSADIAAYPTWAADVKEVTVEEADAEGRPVLVTFRAGAFGRSTGYTLRYDYAEAPGVLSWVQVAGDMTTKLDGRYVFAPAADGGTDVSYHLEVELRVPIPGFVKHRAESRITQTALQELKARAESGA